MDKYPILKITSGILPKLINGKVSDVAIGLLESNPVNFSFHQMSSNENIKQQFDYLKSVLNKDVEYQPDNRIGLIMGYHRHYGHIMLSDPSKESGLIQVVDNLLIFNPNLSPLNKQRDSYLFSSVNEYFTSINFTDIVAEFTSKGYTLKKSTNIKYMIKGMDYKKLSDLPTIRLEDLQ